MRYEYRLEEVDATKSQQYEKDKDAQKERQKQWLQSQKDAADKTIQPQVTEKH